MLGEDVVRAVKKYEAEVTVARAAKVQAPVAKKNIDKKPEVLEVIIDHPPPVLEVTTAALANAFKTPPGNKVKGVEFVEDIPSEDATQDLPAP